MACGDVSLAQASSEGGGNSMKGYQDLTLLLSTYVYMYILYVYVYLNPPSPQCPMVGLFQQPGDKLMQLHTIGQATPVQSP